MIFAAWFRLIKALLRDWLPHSENFTGTIRTDGNTLSQVLNSDWTSAQRHFFLLGQN